MRIVVQGNGVVGSVTSAILREAGHDIVWHDPPQGQMAEGPADILVVCAPCGGGMLPEPPVKARATVVRSTVLPAAFDVLEEGARHHWPEFLTEKTAEWDGRHPDKLVWGSDLGARDAGWFAHALLGSHYNAAPVLHCSLRASCLVKIGINSIYAAKVLLANAIYDALGDDLNWHDADYLDICRGLALDHRITLTHENIWQDGFRGAGGKCLPKDLGFLAEMVAGKPTGSLLEAMCLTNERLMQSAKL